MSHHHFFNVVKENLNFLRFYPLFGPSGVGTQPRGRDGTSVPEDVGSGEARRGTFLRRGDPYSPRSADRVERCTVGPTAVGKGVKGGRKEKGRRNPPRTQRDIGSRFHVSFGDRPGPVWGPPSSLVNGPYKRCIPRGVLGLSWPHAGHYSPRLPGPT